MKIALLGSKGFIGSNIVKRYQGQHELHLPTRDTIDLLDSNQVKNYLRQHNFDVVINCAATFGDQTLLADTRNNLGIFLNFYNHSDLFGKFINTGSGAEFDLSTDINCAREDLIFERVPRDSYGFGHNVKSRMCKDKSNFYTLRIFGCFGYNEKSSRLFNKLVNSETFIIKNNRYFDYISVHDLITIIDYFVYNSCQIKDINCVYKEKLLLSDVVNKFKLMHNINNLIEVESTGFHNYTGNNALLESLSIKLDGLECGIKNYFNESY
jgi:UDP-glucose 4-epimerase